MIKLYYFADTEFVRGGRNWFTLMDPRLLVLLDVFRFRWGRPVEISGHPDALGRVLGPTELSDHNLSRHGAVLAADVLPEGCSSRSDLQRAMALAVEIGFTSIGIYPDWHPSPGLHLGVRHERRPGDPAVWGAVHTPQGQKYVTVADALDRLTLTA